MNNEFPEDRQAMELWQNQKTEGVRMSVEQVRVEAGRFQRKIHWRNMREYVAALAEIALFGYWFLRAKDLLVRVGFALLLAGLAYLVWHLLSKGSPAEAEEEEGAGLSGWIAFRRRELVRQRDLMRSVWLWYIGPLVPGIAVVFIAAARAAHAIRHSLIVWAADALVVVVVFLVVAELNKRGARKLQRQIDELDEQTRG